MNGLRKRCITATLGLVFCAATSAMALSSADIPPEQVQGNVHYMTGGIGTDQQDAMKVVAPSYPLQLEFLERIPDQAAYTAGVGVTIRDSTGRIVLDATSAGPFLYAKLPDGNYTVTANDEGHVSTRRVHVDQSRRQTVIFERPA